jgi:hypothetical protein
MQTCSAALLENAPLDPRKLPNYVFGMVLGPTDFRQVLENFNWKHRNSNLLLHGSGTVCGLKISAKALPGGTDAEIAVAAGFAISPRGRWIRIANDQCAPLNLWLQSQAGTPYASPGPGQKTLYVTLCYNQCLTDLVPIAGQQCAPDSSNQAYSRILETFSLQFAWTPPAQPVEDRARLFGALMRSIEIIDAGFSLPPADDSAALLSSVRALAQDPLPLNFPPPAPFRLNGADAEATIREALLIWVTEICPVFRPANEGAPPHPPGADDSLLLGAVDFTVNAQGQLSIAVDAQNNLLPGSIVIDETERPVLVPSRLLQELFLSGEPAADSFQTGTVTFVPPAPWQPLQTLTQALPPGIAPDAAIALCIEATNPPLPSPPPYNVALTLYQPDGAAPAVLATLLSPPSPPSIEAVTVRWRATRGA